MSLSLLCPHPTLHLPNHTRLFACVLLWFFPIFAFACTSWFWILVLSFLFVGSLGNSACVHFCLLSRFFEFLEFFYVREFLIMGFFTIFEKFSF